MFSGALYSAPGHSTPGMGGYSCAPGCADCPSGLDIDALVMGAGYAAEASDSDSHDAKRSGPSTPNPRLAL